MLARTAAEPWAPQHELAEQRAENDGLVILDATSSTAGRAGRARGQERGDLAAEDLALHLHEERFSLGQGQAQLLQTRVIFAQHDELVNGDLLTIVGGDHELKLEVQRHASDSQTRKRSSHGTRHSSAAGSQRPHFVMPSS
jgi:hypothetical protein